MADDIASLGASWLRDSVVEGVPSSGPNDPSKVEGRQVFKSIGDSLNLLAQASVTGVTVQKATKDALDDDLDHAADTLAIVFNDPVAENNRVYYKIGISGSGSWEPSDLFSEGAVAAAVEAAEAAVAPEVAAAAASASSAADSAEQASDVISGAAGTLAEAKAVVTTTPRPLVSAALAFEVRDQAGRLRWGVGKDGVVYERAGAYLLSGRNSFAQVTSAGDVARAINPFGVEQEAATWDAWVSGGKAYLWRLGVTTLIGDNTSGDWVKAEVSRGQLVLVKADGTRIATPVSGRISALSDGVTTIEYSDMYGQSNAAANASGPVVTAAPARAGRVKMFAGGMRAVGNRLGHSQEKRNPNLIDQTAIHDVVDGYEQLVDAAGETANSSFGWSMTDGASGALASTIAALLTCSAAGSANMEQLWKAATENTDPRNTIGDPWRMLEGKFWRAALLTRLRGLAFVAGPLRWNQGEGNINRSKADHTAALQQVQADWQALAAAAAALPTVGHPGKAPLICVQTVTGPAYGFVDSEVPWAQLGVNLTDPTKFLCAGPVYDQLFAADKAHLLSLGQIMQGARMAQAYKVWRQGGTWKPLHVASAVRTGSIVRLTLYNPTGTALAFDTATITGLGADQGFKFVDVGGTAVVTGAAIIDSTTVDLTLSGVPTGATPYIYVGRTGVNGDSGGPSSGNRCTLRDSGDGSVTIDGRPIRNFVCLDRVAVI